MKKRLVWCATVVPLCAALSVAGNMALGLPLFSLANFMCLAGIIIGGVMAPDESAGNE